ncbi:hypothetical protein V5O48_011194 [Marasmius crinis-equi]|uniref:Uncharacterized protein n=1 Tax=Marasmius crinis-equi TaxID=585013 RepID=A0ABR3F695_9AGAR
MAVLQLVAFSQLSSAQPTTLFPTTHLVLPATLAIAATTVVSAATVSFPAVKAGALIPEVDTSVDELEIFNATVSWSGSDNGQFVGDLAKRASASRIRGGSGETGAVIGQILGELLKAFFPLKDWTPAREQFTQSPKRRQS